AATAAARLAAAAAAAAAAIAAAAAAQATLSRRRERDDPRKARRRGYPAEERLRLPDALHQHAAPAAHAAQAAQGGRRASAANVRGARARPRGAAPLGRGRGGHARAQARPRARPRCQRRRRPLRAAPRAARQPLAAHRRARARLDGAPRAGGRGTARACTRTRHGRPLREALPRCEPQVGRRGRVARTLAAATRIPWQRLVRRAQPQTGGRQRSGGFRACGCGGRRRWGGLDRSARPFSRWPCGCDRDWRFAYPTRPGQAVPPAASFLAYLLPRSQTQPADAREAYEWAREYSHDVKRSDTRDGFLLLLAEDGSASYNELAARIELTRRSVAERVQSGINALRPTELTLARRDASAAEGGDRGDRRGGRGGDRGGDGRGCGEG
ncbi:hypothetical protein T492DRAFT_897921, partial [Pavlovales sp. CCMP2436]